MIGTKINHSTFFSNHPNHNQDNITYICKNTFNLYTTVIRGIYNNGHIQLYEEPIIEAPTEVIVTFPKQVATVPAAKIPQERKSGYAKYFIYYMSPDFDDTIDDLFDVFK